MTRCYTKQRDGKTFGIGLRLHVVDIGIGLRLVDIGIGLRLVDIGMGLRLVDIGMADIGIGSKIF